MKSIQKIIIKTTTIISTVCVSVMAASEIQKRVNKTEKRNAFEGKQVAFVKDENDSENADGVKGHLVVVGQSEYQLTFYDRCIKRGLDIVLTSGGLVVLFPLFLVIAVAIKIDDSGPVFFMQKRLGQNKKYFKLYKFRTMKISAPHDTPTHMLEDSNRYITKVGKFLREHSLDELPQLINVLDGSLSLVGYRPGLWNQDLLTAERDKYGVNELRPGITGWAQINGRDSISIQDKAALDGYWVKYRSLWFDLKCLFGTVSKIGQDNTVVEGKKGTVKREYHLPPPGQVRNDIDFSERKKILLAGKGAYIGEKFREYMSFYRNYTVDSFDTKTDDWKKFDFSDYDVIYYVAGIVHVKETEGNRQLYYRVNRDLAVDIARKAKEEEVHQFIYLSSMSVYGLTCGNIDERTPIKPTNAYGKSKLEAEELLWQLNDPSFVVSIIRPPMVFGKGCRGNYQRLRQFATAIGVFPNYDNQRSMIYIDNLSSSVRGIIHNCKAGVFFPQNIDYMGIFELAKRIAAFNGKKVEEIKVLNGIISRMMLNSTLVSKVFGSLTYEKRMNVPKDWIEVRDNSECVRKTEVIVDDIVSKEKNSKKILVLMSVYNGESFLENQIESIMKQKMNGELVLRIRDDGSTDSSCQRIKNMIEKYPHRIQLIEGENLGYNGSFLKLLNDAEGYDYYSISDQDDVWIEDKIQTAVSFLENENENVPLLYASTSYLTGADLIPYGRTRRKRRNLVFYNTIIQNICPGHTQVMNNALLEILKDELDVSRIYVYYSWITNVAMLFGKILFDNNSHTYYRQHQQNQLGTGKGEIGKLLWSMKHFRDGGGAKYRRQIEYFAEKYKEALIQKGYYMEISKFMKSKYLPYAVKYFFEGKLFRQSTAETCAFYLAVLLGEY